MKIFLFKAVLAFLLLFSVPYSVLAQQPSDSEAAPLIAGWQPSPPFFEVSEGERPSGFIADLTVLIAQEIGVDVVFRRFPSLPDHEIARQNGETHIVAGIPMRSPSKSVFVESDPVGTLRQRLLTRADRIASLRNSTAPLTVAVPKAMTKIARENLTSQFVTVPVGTIADGYLALLSGDTDLLLASEDWAQAWAYRAGLDHMFVPFGAAIRDSSRVVALHKSRADLLPAINSAVARLEESGELATLRRKYHLDIHDPAPDVLTVGFVNYPPYQIIDKDGDPQSFGIDVFRDLAQLAGLRIQFKEISRADVRNGPEAAGVDAIPLVAITPEGSKNWDFTQFLEEIPIGIYVRRDAAKDITGLTDLAGRRVAIIPGDVLDKRIAEVDGLEIIRASSPREAMELLINGTVEAALTRSFEYDPQFNSEIKAQEIVMLDPPLFANHRAVALRFGLGDIRERLNTVIPAYLLSKRFNDLRETHFGEPVFWTERRTQIAIVLVGFGGVVLLFFGVIAIMSMRARRQAETLAKETLIVSNRLGAVMDAARNGIIGLSRAGKIAFANPSARSMLGQGDRPAPFDWPQPISFFEPITGQPIPLDDGPVKRVINGEILDGELACMTSVTDGKMRHVRLASAPVTHSTAHEIATVLILDDVTEEQRQREQAERSGRMGAIGQLTGGVAHDFNNLLAVIMGNLELIKDEDVSQNIEQLADAALNATKRGADLTRNMLAFARKSRLTPEVLDLNEVVRESKNWIGRTLPETVSVETSLLAGLWTVSLDRSSLESALLNLILNARDAMEARGKLTIETANIRIDEAYVDSRNVELAPGRYAMVAISDTGQGIPPGIIDNVFDPFFTTKEQGKGTGLGLSMVMGFVQQSGGTVQVYSEPGKGTSFKVYFPASGLSTAKTPQDLANSQDTGHGIRVLLVEDEAAVREVLITTLERLGYSVTAAASGDEAFKLFQHDPNFDLLVTDIVMPGTMQGTDLAKALRSMRSELPVIFMSGYANEATVHGNGLRPEDIRLMKPVQRSELQAALAKTRPSL